MPFRTKPVLWKPGWTTSKIKHCFVGDVQVVDVHLILLVFCSFRITVALFISNQSPARKIYRFLILDITESIQPDRQKLQSSAGHNGPSELSQSFEFTESAKNNNKQTKKISLFECRDIF